MKKTLKIEIPEGYEIDEKKSTFENIVFKKVDEVVIKWNKNYNGVEIKAYGEHFILDGNPNFHMNWNNAMRFYDNLTFWKLPTVKQLQIVRKYFKEINNVMEDNSGFVLTMGYYWTIEEKNEFCALYVAMGGGTSKAVKGDNFFVRAVSTL